MKKAIAKAMKEYEEYTVQINELLKKQAACKEMLREEVLNLLMDASQQICLC